MKSFAKLLFLFATALASTSVLSARIPLYAMYHTGGTDWFYTTSSSERSYAISFEGYSDQGAAFYVEDTSAYGALPFNRYWKGSPQTDHFYTVDPSEGNTVIGYGWVAEGIEGYLYTTQINGSAPVYRASYWNDPISDLVHRYTTDYNVIQTLQGQGWAYEGVVGYAFTTPGAPDNYKASIIAYHAGEINGSCTSYGAAATVALEQDLEMMHNNGFTVVPLRWMVDWALGTRSGLSMPPKPVAITLDDGYDLDATDGHPSCPGQKSAKTVLLAARSAHPALFADQPLATSFVIASPVARSGGLSYLKDTWWASEKAAGILDIQNHSTDHEHPSVSGPIMENNPHFGGIPLPVGGIVNGVWVGASNFCRIGVHAGGDPNGNIAPFRQIVLSGNYIESVTGVRPDFFATPTGGMASALLGYWANYAYEHRITASFLGGGGYVMRGITARYQFPRWLKGGEWNNSPSELLNLLKGNGTGTNPLC